jgi:transposase InsO family protein
MPGRCAVTSVPIVDVVTPAGHARTLERRRTCHSQPSASGVLVVATRSSVTETANWRWTEIGLCVVNSRPSRSRAHSTSTRRRANDRRLARLRAGPKRGRGSDRAPSPMPVSQTHCCPRWTSQRVCTGGGRWRRICAARVIRSRLHPGPADGCCPGWSGAAGKHHDPRRHGLSSSTGSAGPQLHRRGAEPQVGQRLHLLQNVVGFVHVAFVMDCFSRSIVGWHAATVKDTAMVTTALKMALWRRDHSDHRVGPG